MATVCKYNNPRCLCQRCEEPCNNGLMCHECDISGEQKHNCYMCTGFVGTYPNGIRSDKIKRKAEELLKKRERRLTMWNRELLKNKICSLILIGLGALSILIEYDGTFFLFTSMLGIPLFCSKEKWIV